MFHLRFFRFHNRHNKFMQIERLSSAQPLQSIVYKSWNNLTAVGKHKNLQQNCIDWDCKLDLANETTRATARPIKFCELETFNLIYAERPTETADDFSFPIRLWMPTSSILEIKKVFLGSKEINCVIKFTIIYFVCLFKAQRLAWGSAELIR